MCTQGFEMSLHSTLRLAAYHFRKQWLKIYVEIIVVEVDFFSFTYSFVTAFFSSNKMSGTYFYLRTYFCTIFLPNFLNMK